MIASTLIASSHQRNVNRERAIASNAASILFERMRNEDLLEVVKLYNAEPFDDPGGPGTAPGQVFNIQGLVSVDAAANMPIAQILLPVVNTGGPIAAVWEVREDLDLPELGMPRDLNGDAVIDSLDHTDDYRVLPVAVIARWRSRLGQREFRMHTLLADWKAAL